MSDGHNTLHGLAPADDNTIVNQSRKERFPSTVKAAHKAVPSHRAEHG